MKTLNIIKHALLLVSCTILCAMELEPRMEFVPGPVTKLHSSLIKLILEQAANQLNPMQAGKDIRSFLQTNRRFRKLLDDEDFAKQLITAFARMKNISQYEAAEYMGLRWRYPYVATLGPSQLSNLPAEMLWSVIENVLIQSPFYWDALENIKNLLNANKAFRYDEDLAARLVQEINKRYKRDNLHPIRIAKAINTPAMRKIIYHWKQKISKKILQEIGLLNSIAHIQDISFKALPDLILVTGILKPAAPPSSDQRSVFIAALDLNETIAPKILLQRTIKHSSWKALNGILYKKLEGPHLQTRIVAAKATSTHERITLGYAFKIEISDEKGLIEVLISQVLSDASVKKIRDKEVYY